MTRQKGARKTQILQSLAQMLENEPGSRITTAKLAEHVGVSEAALYRHFPSKAKMFEGLIEFIEDTIFSRINLVMQETQSPEERLHAITNLVLGFAEKNPGMCRILMGDALAGEVERLRKRIAQFFERLQMQVKQILRETALQPGLQLNGDSAQLAELVMATTEGRIMQFVRSEFERRPTQGWPLQWAVLSRAIFAPAS